MIIIIYCADLLYSEGQKILDEGKNYGRYYARRYFVKAEKIKSYIDENLKKQMEYSVEKLYNGLEKNYVNKLGEVDSFVNALRKQIKLKDTPFVNTGYSVIENILNKAFEPEYIDISLDIFTDMAESLSQDNNNYSEIEAFCIVNIIKIKFKILNHKSPNDMEFYKLNIDRMDLIIDRLGLEEEDAIWMKEYYELKSQIEEIIDEMTKKKEEEKHKKNQKYIEELRSVYETKMIEKNPKGFIEFILNKYPYIGFNHSKDSLKDISWEEALDLIFAKYHTDNYSKMENREIYNEIYILLGQMKDDFQKYK